MPDRESADASAAVVKALVPSSAAGLPALVGLCRHVEWSADADQPEALHAAIAGSAHVVVTHRGQQLVGAARVVSDGVSTASLQDLLVHPDHQRQGVGSSLREAAFEPFAGVRQQVLVTDDEPRQRGFSTCPGLTKASEHARGSLHPLLRPSPARGRESLDP
ncbi:GNAT family N-acetyltransferase [Quadrisphaera sp. KR29]|uniref:GNAT family N-acetyltransferase n=1 Tax=Quadrisphaera sp. KR29 TaxID=3461391 RepID=UPI0040445D77